MDLTLALSAFLMGLAGAPHCTAMCGPACAAVLGPAPRGGGALAAPVLGFHLTRVLSYAAAGAVAAVGVAWMGAASAAAPLLRPAWTLVHIAAMTLGLWMLWTARQPEWMTRLARRAPSSANPGSWQVVRGPRAAWTAGALWVAWPCGLLHSALVVAGLANTASGGALVMASFAVASAAGLQIAPWAWSRWVSSPSGVAASSTGAQRRAAWLVRSAGGLLVVGSAWALGMDVWGRVWDYCFG